MLRKLMFVIVALALPLVAANAASAQQYPPSDTEVERGPEVLNTGASNNAGKVSKAGSAQPAGAANRSAGAPLARTGTDLAVPGTVAVVLLAGGALALVASRRRSGAGALA